MKSKQMKKVLIVMICVFVFAQLEAQQSTIGKYRPENVSKGITLKYSTNKVLISMCLPIYGVVVVVQQH